MFEHSKLRLISVAPAACAILMLLGCGESGESVCHVAGEVTYAGTPLDRAVINFFPVSGRPIGSPLNDKGRYEIELLPGDYDVAVTAPTPLPEGWQEGDPLPSQRPRIPRYYSHRKRSGLTATIPADQDRLELDFPLE